MKATIGDWVVIRPEQAGAHVREGMVVGAALDGSPPWRVRWTDDDRETVLYPGPDAHVQHEPPHASPPRETPKPTPV